MKHQGRVAQRHERIKNAHITEDGMSYDEIAKILGLTVQQVKIIEKSALNKLSTPTKKNQKLHRYWKI